MTEIVPLFGEVPEGTPDPEVIALLELYLERAKRGEIAAVGIATVTPHSRVMSSAWHFTDHTRESLYTSVSILERRIMDDIVG